MKKEFTQKIDRLTGMSIDLFIVNNENNIVKKTIRITNIKDPSIDMKISEHILTHLDDILNNKGFDCPHGMNIKIDSARIEVINEEEE